MLPWHIYFEFHVAKIEIFAIFAVPKFAKTENMPAKRPLSLDDILRYDDAAVKFLFEHYYVQLVVFAKNWLPDIEDCKDVVQEIFIHIVEYKEPFDSLGKLKAYLYQSVRNRCLKFLRHEEVKQRYAEEMRAVSEEAYYLDRMLEEEVYVHLMNAIDALPSQCGRVFRLVLENKSNQEIADALSISVETVKSYKKEGKALLYKHLKDIIPMALLAVWLSC